MFNKAVLALALICLASASFHKNEFIQKSERKPTMYANDFLESLPDAFDWSNKDGVNYLTKSQN